jgi:DNA-directed RNA polymerase subunit RPC12/RpoP
MKSECDTCGHTEELSDDELESRLPDFRCRECSEKLEYRIGYRFWENQDLTETSAETLEFFSGLARDGVSFETVGDNHFATIETSVYPLKPVLTAREIKVDGETVSPQDGETLTGLRKVVLRTGFYRGDQSWELRFRTGSLGSQFAVERQYEPTTVRECP